MSDGQRVTQQDIALRAKLDRSTVSLALRNHPSIQLKTRKRIQAIAEELGYSPDPMLAALASYRNKVQPASYHGTLAWLSNSAFGYDWRAKAHFRDYFAAAAQRAKTFGYNVEEFDINSPNVTRRRLASILRARNISGILVAPQPKPETELEFPWEQFSAVKFGYSMVKPELHTFATTHYRNASRVAKNVYALGYRRVGLAFTRTQEQRLDNSYLAAYLAEEFLEHSAIQIPPFMEDRDKNSPQFVAWLRKYKLDAIVAGSPVIKEFLAKAGLRIPQDVGIALCGMPKPHPGFAGVVEDSFRVGEAAVDCLISMIQRGERGVPELPVRTLVEGYWVDGDSLPPASSVKGKSRRTFRPSPSLA